MRKKTRKRDNRYARRKRNLSMKPREMPVTLPWKED